MQEELQPAAVGAGPLLQRDYWALLRECPLKPSELMAHVKVRFCELPPAALLAFEAPDGVPLGAELDIHIKPAQHCRVRVLHEDTHSLTLGTLRGHPEAGRITFGAYRNREGDVIFHIRSRARASGPTNLVGFLAIGEAMQTNTWTDFINNTAIAAGATIDGQIHADTITIDESDDTEDPQDSPTFRAVGD